MLYNRRDIKKRGFTIIEMTVSIAIFAFMTAFLIAKYGSFNQSILLTNLAYDIALTLRNAQSYGLNVKSAPDGTQNYSSNFNYAYGVHFDKSTTAKSKEMIFFVDRDDNGLYDSDNNEKISLYTIKNRFFIFDLCVGQDSRECIDPISIMDITFKRPDPNALIQDSGSNKFIYGDITVQSGSNSNEKRKVKITDLGQISVVK